MWIITIPNFGSGRSFADGLNESKLGGSRVSQLQASGGVGTLQSRASGLQSTTQGNSIRTTKRLLHVYSKNIKHVLIQTQEAVSHPLVAGALARAPVVHEISAWRFRLPRKSRPPPAKCARLTWHCLNIPEHRLWYIAALLQTTTFVLTPFGSRQGRQTSTISTITTQADMINYY